MQSLYKILDLLLTQRLSIYSSNYCTPQTAVFAPESRAEKKNIPDRRNCKEAVPLLF